MHNAFYSRSPHAVFVMCWVTGLGLGILAAMNADLSVVSLMRPAAFRRVSIVLLLLWSSLPLWITAWSVMIQNFKIFFLSVVLRCFCFGFLLWLEVRAFGSGAWLMVPFSRFSDWLSLGAFCWFSLGCLRDRKWHRRDLWISMFITILAVIADYCLVSPFLAKL